MITYSIVVRKEAKLLLTIGPFEVKSDAREHIAELEEYQQPMCSIVPNLPPEDDE